MADDAEPPSVGKADEPDGTVRDVDGEAGTSWSPGAPYRAHEPPGVEDTHAEAARVPAKALAKDRDERTHVSPSRTVEGRGANRPCTGDVAEGASAGESRQRAE